MKRVLMKTAVFLFVLGINMTVVPAWGSDAPEDAWKYGPLVLDNALVLPKKTFEVIGFYNAASPTIEINWPTAPTGPDDDPGTKKEYSLPISGLNGAVSYGLTDILEVGISASNVSRDYIASGSTTTQTVNMQTVSGMSDLTLKAKVGNGKVAGSVLVFLPTGADGISSQDNDMDIAFKFAWTPVLDGTGGMHLNLGLTKWGKDDTPQKQSSTFDYGLGTEFFLGRSKSVTITAELAGNTFKNQENKTPFDLYSGMRIRASDNVQISGLLGLGFTDGSGFGKWGIGYGIGLKVLFGI